MSANAALSTAAVSAKARVFHFFASFSQARRYCREQLPESRFDELDSFLLSQQMDRWFEPSQFQSELETSTPALQFQLQDDDPQTARVAATQQLLLPSTPQAICEEIGLNSWAALKLYEDGWLSFCPETTLHIDEAQEAELRFIGSLVLTGCDRSMLARLLAGLPKAYAYDLKRLYYDWMTHRWRALPDPKAHPEAAFTDWLETLVQAGDAGSLTGIVELARDALTRLSAQSAQPELAAQSWSASSSS